MKSFRVFLLMLVLSTPLVEPLFAQTAAPVTTDSGKPRALLYTDLEYGVAKGVRLLLDVSVPAGKGPFPVVSLEHGGGWASGDQQQDITPLFAPL